MTELKPCPCCGGEAKRIDVEGNEDDENFGGSYIECQRCGLCTMIYFGEKVGLKEGWNLRVLDRPIENALRDLVYAVEDLYPLDGHSFSYKDAVDSELRKAKEALGDE